MSHHTTDTLGAAAELWIELHDPLAEICEAHALAIPPDETEVKNRFQDLTVSLSDLQRIAPTLIRGDRGDEHTGYVSETIEEMAGEVRDCTDKLTEYLHGDVKTLLKILSTWTESSFAGEKVFDYTQMITILGKAPTLGTLLPVRLDNLDHAKIIRTAIATLLSTQARGMMLDAAGEHNIDLHDRPRTVADILSEYRTAIGDTREGNGLKDFMLTLLEDGRVSNDPATIGNYADLADWMGKLNPLFASF